MKKITAFIIFWFFQSVHAVVLITDEDFENGASGWSNNTTDQQGIFTQFLGRFSNETVNKNYTLSGTQTEVTIEFDFYEIDSWDGERFNFFVNGLNIFSDEFEHNRNDFVDSNFMNAESLLFAGDDGTVNYGFNSFPDQGFHYTYTFNTTATNVLLGFGSTLNQSLNDESWGIDNVRITTNDAPEPSIIFLLGLGFAGIRFAKK